MSALKHKKILVIYTGGTIGMCPTEQGFQPKPNWLEGVFKLIQELQDPRMPAWDLLEYDPLLDSSNASPELWQKIANDIGENYHDYDGFLVLHGTDTMAYSASAVSFLLENLAKPVIFTGSQLPLSEIRSDARQNILNALYIMAYFNLYEVCVYFDNKLLRANRSVKTSATRYSAFESPNYPVLAKTGVRIELRSKHLLAPPSEAFVLHQLKQDIHIASMRLFPGIDFDIVQNILKRPIQALVIESYGAGNAPTNREDLHELLSQAAQDNILVINCTQCLHGFVNTDIYETGCMFAASGVVGVADMTIEAVLTKLYFVLSQDLNFNQKRKFMSMDLRGEMTV